MQIYIRHRVDDKDVFYYRAEVSQRWAVEHDNGAIFSCGLTVGEDGLELSSLQALIRQGKAVEVSYDEWNHSGCQSSCIRRGAKECRW